MPSAGLPSKLDSQIAISRPRFWSGNTARSASAVASAASEVADSGGPVSVRARLGARSSLLSAARQPCSSQSGLVHDASGQTTPARSLLSAARQPCSSQSGLVHDASGQTTPARSLLSAARQPCSSQSGLVHDASGQQTAAPSPSTTSQPARCTIAALWLNTSASGTIDMPERVGVRD